ncbi:eukaryotic translation initiation factor 3 subunit F [Elysia marginata]|uniref:Eukaryotic translation initiation factor 3 subunit F n=1 Tax=Elysia marginata TaxID=1093978 RepID=A0AAV4H9K0_9GAST|nr:eukaryotic translation initiation factor 3 subunit F [Elysia marginata]
MCRRKTVTTAYEAEIKYAGLSSRGSSGTLLKGKIEGKRRKGRPRRNWMDDVKEWSGSTSYGNTKRKAENREEWRNMVAKLRTEDGTRLLLYANFALISANPRFFNMLENL